MLYFTLSPQAYKIPAIPLYIKDEEISLLKSLAKVTPKKWGSSNSNPRLSDSKA